MAKLRTKKGSGGATSSTSALNKQRLLSKKDRSSPQRLTKALHELRGVFRSTAIENIIRLAESVEEQETLDFREKLLTLHAAVDGITAVISRLHASASAERQDRKSEVASPFAFKTDEERLSYFAGRQKWADAKRQNPNLTPPMHIESIYPDRHHGLLRSDLLDARIDPKLYRALYSWLNATSRDGRRNELPAEFNLPTKKQWNNQLLRTRGSPSAAEVFRAFRRGDPVATELNRLYSAARRRQRKSKL